LRSLSKIFPNLRVIGGQSLVMNYALIVYQNVDLKEIGLYKLTTIRNGGVRITENTRLCFSRTIDWSAIMTGDVNDVLVDQSKNHGILCFFYQFVYYFIDQCVDECTPINKSLCHRKGNEHMISCLGPHHCQIRMLLIISKQYCSISRLQLFTSGK
jgi:hypothetical protein